MRLLRIADLQFEDFHSQETFPAYAILSHTWISPNLHEVSLQDLQTTDHEAVKKKPGWTKIQYLMEQAAWDDLEYVWADTCCINQLNPTELSESINTMFKWYQNAAVCYAYLSDVSVISGSPIDLPSIFRDCRWMTRGRTLQELIGPSQVFFFDRE